MEKILKEIIKLADEEAGSLKYYGWRESRDNETFEDLGFYDRMVPIGYAKVVLPLDRRCPRSFLSSLDINDVKFVSGPRNHSKGVYTPLEFIIYNKIGPYQDFIKNIKDVWYGVSGTVK